MIPSPKRMEFYIYIVYAVIYIANTNVYKFSLPSQLSTTHIYAFSLPMALLVH